MHLSGRYFTSLTGGERLEPRNLVRLGDGRRQTEHNLVQSDARSNFRRRSEAVQPVGRRHGCNQGGNGGRHRPPGVGVKRSEQASLGSRVRPGFRVELSAGNLTAAVNVVSFTPISACLTSRNVLILSLTQLNNSTWVAGLSGKSPPWRKRG